ncbi:hypothetical protein B484DRAFT_77373 [Ochromonadaceae sp. CCMP2298]|nr:hypothetical protein B484DRAFT_77373 [Ochromonadaceae sp. CCMP2298]
MLFSWLIEKVNSTIAPTQVELRGYKEEGGVVTVRLRYTGSRTPPGSRKTMTRAWMTSCSYGTSRRCPSYTPCACATTEMSSTHLWGSS